MTFKSLLTLLGTIFLLAATATSSATPIQVSNSTKQVFGYYANWSVYGRNYQPDQIPINDLTAVIYAFTEVGNCAAPFATDANPTLCNASGQYGTATGVQDYKLYSADAYADFKIIPQGYKHAGENGLGSIAKIINKAHAQHKPVLLSIGGWTLSVPLRTAMDATHRDAFIQSIISFLNTVKADNNGDGFDGIDIDFEPNDWSIITPQNIADYANFLQALRTALQKQYASSAWLTVATWGNVDTINQVGASNWQIIANSVDYIDVMTYDYHAGWDNPKVTNLLAPLHFDPNQPNNVTGRTTFNADNTIQAYLAQGVPANKLIFGFPSYGRAVVGVPNIAPNSYPNAFGLYQSFTSIPNGEWDNDGVFDYKYIVSKMLDQGYTDYQLVGTSAAYNPNVNGGTFISFDNTSNIREKAQYVIANNLAGMMVWELSSDVNVNDPSYNANSLVHTAHESLNK